MELNKLFTSKNYVTVDDDDLAHKMTIMMTSLILMMVISVASVTVMIILLKFIIMTTIVTVIIMLTILILMLTTQTLTVTITMTILVMTIKILELIPTTIVFSPSLPGIGGKDATSCTEKTG